MTCLARRSGEGGGGGGGELSKFYMFRDGEEYVSLGTSLSYGDF